MTGACVPDGSDARLYTSDPADARWVRDSLLLDTRPDLLFRLAREGSDTYVVPIATIGSAGVRRLQLSKPGWRRVDAEYLRAGVELPGYAAGRAARTVRLFRGMWQPGLAPLDSLPCSSFVPRAQAIIESGAGAIPRLAATGDRPAPRGTRLADAPLAAVLDRIGTLVAPTVGIPPSQLPRYERRVTQVPSGINGGTTLVVEFNAAGNRPPTVRGRELPRNFVVVLDRGAYDYRPTFTYATSADAGTPPALALLDFLDLGNDGVPELLFGLRDSAMSPFYTLVLRYEADAWREVLRVSGNRCDT